MLLDVNRGSYEPLDPEIRKEYSSLLTGIAFCLVNLIEEGATFGVGLDRSLRQLQGATSSMTLSLLGWTIIKQRSWSVLDSAGCWAQVKLRTPLVRP